MEKLVAFFESSKGEFFSTLERWRRRGRVKMKNKIKYEKLKRSPLKKKLFTALFILCVGEKKKK
jgi:hypothetical protein